MGIFEGPIGFNQSQFTGTYTSPNNGKCDISFDALLKIMEDLPEPPTMYRFGIDVNPMLPKNTIMISGDIADKINLEIGKAK